MDLLIYAVPHSHVFGLQLGAVFQENVHIDLIDLSEKVQSAYSDFLPLTSFFLDNLEGDFLILSKIGKDTGNHFLVTLRIVR